MVLESESVSDAGAWLALRNPLESHLGLIEPVKVADSPARAGYGRTPVVAGHCQGGCRYWQSLCRLGQYRRHVS